MPRSSRSLTAALAVGNVVCSRWRTCSTAGLLVERVGQGRLGALDPQGEQHLLADGAVGQPIYRGGPGLQPRASALRLAFSNQGQLYHWQAMSKTTFLWRVSGHARKPARFSSSAQHRDPAAGWRPMEPYACSTGVEKTERCRLIGLFREVVRDRRPRHPGERIRSSQAGCRQQPPPVARRPGAARRCAGPSGNRRRLLPAARL